MHSLDITTELEGQRLDVLLVRELGIASRARIKRLFAAGEVCVVDAAGRRRRAVKGERAVAGTSIEVAGEVAEDAATPDPDLPLTLALERDDLVVVDKPAGVPSAPLRAGELGTIASALLARYPEMRNIGFSPREPGLCHRLDTGTSGLLLAARTPDAFEALSEAIVREELDKRYLLICSPPPMEHDGVIDIPLAADPKNRRRVRACGHPHLAAQLAARPARTSYRVLRITGDRALVEARVARAHRHQIRAHFAAIESPLLGDALYGGLAMEEEGRHALHASRISWAGTASIAGFDVSSKLPEELERWLH
jgi:23S rRNA pseudouridine1911/1915/1917 synthase